VFVAWLVVAIVTTAVAGAAGRDYATNFSLPGTESQRALDLLKKEFPAQSGDVDTIVFHNANGTVDDPQVRAAMTKLLGQVSGDPHVVSVRSPYGPDGSVQVSRDRKTAFATINYDKPANVVPNDAGTPVLDQVGAVDVPGLTVAAGGQVIENAEGFTVGPATLIGAIAALIILLFTFGSLVAAGMPLITAGFGLISGVALIGLATHFTSIPNVSTDLALMIGLGVGVDYALFIVTRFRENYLAFGDVEQSVMEAMDTSGRAILLAGTTVMIALLGMFATGVSFLYGLAIASVFAVLMTMFASLTVLPAMLSKYGHRIVRPRTGRGPFGRRSAEPATAGAAVVEDAAPHRSRWREWSRTVQRRPWPLALISTGLMIVLLLPVFALRLESSDAGNDPSGTTSRHAFDLLGQGFGGGFNGPLLIVTELPSQNKAAAQAAVSAAVAKTPNVVAVTPPRISPSGNVAVFEAYPGSAPQAVATTDLVNHLRDDVAPPIEHQSGATVLVGGFTAGSIDFSHVLANKLPLFIGIVVALSFLLLVLVFRSLLIPLTAAIMNALSAGAAFGVVTAVFQFGWGASLLGINGTGPIEAFLPVLMFPILFGLSMDYEVFLISRVYEEWHRRGNNREAVTHGLAATGRTITAAATIMVLVFGAFVLGGMRIIELFGIGLASAVLLDALIVRSALVPAVMILLGDRNWWLPARLERVIPHMRIEGSAGRAAAEERAALEPAVPEPEPAPS
jgi:RND superfamily putative drug exporter